MTNHLTGGPRRTRRGLGEDSARIRRGFGEDSEDSARIRRGFGGLGKDSARTRRSRRGFGEDSARIRRGVGGLGEDSARTRRGLGGLGYSPSQVSETKSIDPTHSHGNKIVVLDTRSPHAIAGCGHTRAVTIDYAPASPSPNKHATISSRVVSTGMTWRNSGNGSHPSARGLGAAAVNRNDRAWASG